jgi:hypothetical protein
MKQFGLFQFLSPQRKLSMLKRMISCRIVLAGVLAMLTCLSGFDS